MVAVSKTWPGSARMIRTSSFEARIAVAMTLALVAGLVIVWVVVALFPAT
jgi:hypothetical protein